MAHEVVLMADMNEYISDKGDLYNFYLDTDLIDSISLLNPDLEENPTYLWEVKRLDYIFMTSGLAEVALKAGHHQFHQHFVSDHKGAYLQFRASGFFDIELMDKSHVSYRILRLGRSDIVEKYIEQLEQLYEEHRILERAEALASEIIMHLETPLENGGMMKVFISLDQLDKERVKDMTSAENYSGKAPHSGICKLSPLLEKTGRIFTYWKLRLNLLMTSAEPPLRMKAISDELKIRDAGCNDKPYIKAQLSEAWTALHQVQRRSKNIRQTHMKVLADHYAEKRNTVKAIYVKKINHLEVVRGVAAKHKWYLKDRHGMIRNLLVPDYQIHQILAIFGVLAWKIIIVTFSGGHESVMVDAIIIMTVTWGAFTV